MRKITMKNTSENGGSVRDKSEDRATNFSEQDDDNKHDAMEKDANKSIDTDKSFVDSENEKQSDLDNDNNSDLDGTQTGKSKSKKVSKKRTKKNAGNAAINGKIGGKKKPKKKKGTTERKSNAATEEDTEEEYEVEKVVDKKRIGSKTYFLIRWKGYSASDDTWEAENTLNCDALIKEYLEKAKKESPQSRKRGPETPRRTQRVDYTEDEEEEEYSSFLSTPRKRKFPSTTPTSKGKKVRKDASDDEPPEEYEVEKILKVQNTKKGGREFLVRWKGYPESQATWEPEKNLNCRDLLDRFLEKQKENHSPSKNKKVAPKIKKKAAKSGRRGGRAKAR